VDVVLITPRVDEALTVYWVVFQQFLVKFVQTLRASNWIVVDNMRAGRADPRQFCALGKLQSVLIRVTCHAKGTGRGDSGGNPP